MGDLTVTGNLFVQGPNPWIDVKEYGAVGNGSTDDTTPVQNAINAASSGGVVWFPVGTYKITAPLTISSGLRLEGAGPGNSQLKFVYTVSSGTVVKFLSGTNADNLQLINLNLDMTSVTIPDTAGTDVRMLSLTGAQRLLVSRCSLNAPSTVLATAETRGIYIEPNGNPVTHSSWYNRIIDNVISNFGEGVALSGIAVANGHSGTNVIRDNIFTSGQTNIAVGDIHATSVIGLVVSGNTFAPPRNHILIDGGSTATGDVLVDGNWFDAGALPSGNHRITLSAVSGATDVQVICIGNRNLSWNDVVDIASPIRAIVLDSSSGVFTIKGTAH